MTEMVGLGGYRTAFARYIAQHETFPDPDLEIAREVAVKICEGAGLLHVVENIKAKELDNHVIMKIALACIKAGREAERNGR